MYRNKILIFQRKYVSSTLLPLLFRVTAGKGLNISKRERPCVEILSPFPAYIIIVHSKHLPHAYDSNVYPVTPVEPAGFLD